MIGDGHRTARPRQKRAVATRAALLETVEAIVAAEGIDAVTTTRVAADAGTAVGTLYRYFPDRDEMLLAAYDAVVERVLDNCRAELGRLPEDGRVEDAARHLLDAYLAATDAITAYAGLRAAMRKLRPIEAHRNFLQNRIVRELLEPFSLRFAPTGHVRPDHIKLISVVLGALVDLYLATSGVRERARLREEIDAHLVFMVSRAT